MTNQPTPRTAWRLRVYPMAALVALVAALLLATVTFDADDTTSRLGGDYPAFYGAGSIAADGDWDELYSGARQQEEQSGLIDDDGGYLYFSYPPFVAGAYGLLAIPGYQWSFLIHVLLMGMALLGSIWVLRPWLAGYELPTAALLALALAFYPILRAVSGGQNTALSLLLFAAAARLDHEDRPFAAGLVAAGLLFKPQFAVVVVPLLVVSRRWRVLTGWSVGAIVLYALSTVLMGGAWISDWWSQAGGFRDLNVDANGSNFVSVPGFIENIFGSGVMVSVGYAIGVLVGAAVAILWVRMGRRHPLQRWGLAAAAAVVVAPQTLYYDVGLMLIALVVALPYFGSKVRIVAVAVGVSWLQLAVSSLGWSPLGPIGWAVMLAALLAGWKTVQSTWPHPATSGSASAVS